MMQPSSRVPATIHRARPRGQRVAQHHTDLPHRGLFAHGPTSSRSVGPTASPRPDWPVRPRTPLPPGASDRSPPLWTRRSAGPPPARANPALHAAGPLPPATDPDLDTSFFLVW